MAFLKDLFKSRNKSSSYQSSTTSYSSAPSYPTSAKISKSGYFQFSSGVLPEMDNRYAKATFEDGVVYYNFSGKLTPIGYYEKAQGTTRTDIFCEFDKSEIGYVDEDGYIYLSRMGLYRRFTSQGTCNTFPNPSILEVGRMYGSTSGSLDEASTHINLGSFDGDRAGAAAAFVCLVYECHTYYKYRKFYDRWD